MSGIVDLDHVYSTEFQTLAFCNSLWFSHLQFPTVTVTVTGSILDLPQVDLMNFRVEYVRPRSRRFLGREAGERATKSWEVDLSRLKGFHLHFTPKMRDGIGQMTFGSCIFHCDQNNIEWLECVCVSPTASKGQIQFVYSVLKWLRTKILN